MIKEVEMYTVICDNCGVDSNKGSEYIGWNDKGFAVDCALDDDWHKEDDKHYCKDCYSFDDEDNLIIKEIK